MIFGRTDLRKGVSGAKFDARSDFDVRLAVAPQKPDQNCEKLIFRLENFQKFSFRFFGVFSASKCRRRLKLSNLIDFELADVLIYDFSRQRCQNKSKIQIFFEIFSKNYRDPGVGGMRGA